MRLIWKVLRQNISIGQLFGFVLANIIGLTIIVLGLQLYKDIQPIMGDKAGFMRPDYMVVSKQVSTESAIYGEKTSFTQAELDDIRSQEFVAKVGVFTSAQYRVYVSLVFDSYELSTEMFFESVPDDFIDVNSEDWTFQPGDELVPIVLPRAYLNLYSFGYAPSSSFGSLSEEMINAMIIDLSLGKGALEVHKKGRVIGFSARLNTILVPASFMEWANATLAPDAPKEDASRIIVQVTNPTDERIAAYFEAHHLNVEGDKLDSSKASWFVRLLISGVMMVGLVICILACYVLILSIFLLMQRNHDVIRNLRAIGYTAAKVSLPYQLLVLFTNMVSVITALVGLVFIRKFYLTYLYDFAPEYEPASLVLAVVVLIGFGLLISAVNALLIRRSIDKTC